MTPPDPRQPSAHEDLQQQAWAWLRLFNGGRATREEIQSFEAWLQASAANAEAFDAARRRWELLKPVAGELLRTHRPAAEFHERTLTMGNAGIGRRSFLKAVGIGAAAAGAAVLYPRFASWSALNGADYRTLTGEQRTVTLAERVVVVLNTQTSIRQLPHENRVPAIGLLAGEAAIDLPDNGASDFIVVAGAGRVHAESGRFEVRYVDARVCVTCIDGSLRVEHPTGVRELRTRQQTIYDSAALGAIATIEPARISSWRQGMLVFEQARLADVLEEINRYRPGRVMLFNDGVRNQPVSGSFFIASLEQTLSQLQHTFGLRARALPGGVLVLS